MSTPVPNDPPHVEIEVAAAAVINIYQRQRRYLRSKDAGYINDLLSAAKELERHEDFSLRVGAEINRAAAVMVLSERGIAGA